MTDGYLKKIFCDIVAYKCPHCGEINNFHKFMIDLFRKNKIDYIVCEGCDAKIKI